MNRDLITGESGLLVGELTFTGAREVFLRLFPLPLLPLSRTTLMQFQAFWCCNSALFYVCFNLFNYHCEVGIFSSARSRFIAKVFARLKQSILSFYTLSPMDCLLSRTIFFSLPVPQCSAVPDEFDAGILAKLISSETIRTVEQWSRVQRKLSARRSHFSWMRCSWAFLHHRAVETKAMKLEDWCFSAFCSAIDD